MNHYIDKYEAARTAEVKLRGTDGVEKTNFINKDSKNLIRNTNNRLRKNYRILETLNPNKKTKCSRAKLIEKGFDFNYFTSIYTTKAGAIYYFVYDQGYLPLENDYYALVKRES